MTQCDCLFFGLVKSVCSCKWRLMLRGNVFAPRLPLEMMINAQLLLLVLEDLVHSFDGVRVVIV